MNKDKLTPEAITNNLGTRFIGQRVLYFPSVTSTNDVAKQEARRRAAEGTVVIADEQTAGKGRLGRIWTSPEGTLAYSVILYPEIIQLPYLIMVASLSVVYAIQEITGLKAQIKWPNDVQINGKKVCGILIENSLRGNAVDYAVIGIGVNVNLNLEAYPEIATTATSLSGESGREFSLLSMVRQLLVELDKLYLTLSNSDAIFEEWRNNLATLGQKVKATSGDTVYEGTAESVERDGSLVLRQSDGTRARISQGDVTLRK
jgi:BirA family biotin operon repressor/biotin-[acetyl-CoA-carboxylase] ligase